MTAGLPINTRRERKIIAKNAKGKLSGLSEIFATLAFLKTRIFTDKKTLILQGLFLRLVITLILPAFFIGIGRTEWEKVDAGS